MSNLTITGNPPHRPGNLARTDLSWVTDLLAARRRAQAAAKAADPNWRPLIFGVDLDGVNYPFGENYYASLVRTGEYAAEDLGPITDWYFYRGIGQSDEQFVANCHAFVDSGHLFATGDPYPDTIEHWARVIEAGHEIHVVTDRRFGTGLASLDGTVAWLDAVMLPYDSITISPDKTVINADAFIEDRLENYDDLDEAGINGWLINRAWNAVPGDDRRRVTSVAEFVAKALDGTLWAVAEERAA